MIYTLDSAEAVPLKRDDLKAYMKVTTDDDNDVITGMMEAAVAFGERYTSRDFRVKAWTLLLDDFDDPIELRRSPVASITSIKYLLDDVWTAISSDDYYLKKLVWWSEIHLSEDSDWPSDADEIDHRIEIKFKTEAYNAPELILAALKLHIAFWYENRGDVTIEDAAEKSGATALYDQFRIPRF